MQSDKEISQSIVHNESPVREFFPSNIDLPEVMQSDKTTCISSVNSSSFLPTDESERSDKKLLHPVDDNELIQKSENKPDKDQLKNVQFSVPDKIVSSDSTIDVLFDKKPLQQNMVLDKENLEHTENKNDFEDIENKVNLKQTEDKDNIKGADNKLVKNPSALRSESEKESKKKKRRKKKTKKPLTLEEVQNRYPDRKIISRGKSWKDTTPVKCRKQNRTSSEPKRENSSEKEDSWLSVSEKDDSLLSEKLDSLSSLPEIEMNDTGNVPVIESELNKDMSVQNDNNVTEASSEDVNVSLLEVKSVIMPTKNCADSTVEIIPDIVADDTTMNIDASSKLPCNTEHLLKNCNVPVVQQTDISFQPADPTEPVFDCNTPEIPPPNIYPSNLGTIPTMSPPLSTVVTTASNISTSPSFVGPCIINHIVQPSVTDISNTLYNNSLKSKVSTKEISYGKTNNDKPNYISYKEDINNIVSTPIVSEDLENFLNDNVRDCCTDYSDVYVDAIIKLKPEETDEQPEKTDEKPTIYSFEILDGTVNASKIYDHVPVTGKFSPVNSDSEEILEHPIALLKSSRQEPSKIPRLSHLCQRSISHSNKSKSRKLSEGELTIFPQSEDTLYPLELSDPSTSAIHLPEFAVSALELPGATSMVLVPNASIESTKAEYRVGTLYQQENEIPDIQFSSETGSEPWEYPSVKETGIQSHRNDRLLKVVPEVDEELSSNPDSPLPPDSLEEVVSDDSLDIYKPQKPHFIKYSHDLCDDKNSNGSKNIWDNSTSVVDPTYSFICADEPQLEYVSDRSSSERNVDKMACELNFKDSEQKSYLSNCKDNKREFISINTPDDFTRTSVSPEVVPVHEKQTSLSDSNSDVLEKCVQNILQEIENNYCIQKNDDNVCDPKIFTHLENYTEPEREHTQKDNIWTEEGIPVEISPSENLATETIKSNNPNQESILTIIGSTDTPPIKEDLNKLTESLNNDHMKDSSIKNEIQRIIGNRLTSNSEKSPPKEISPQKEISDLEDEGFEGIEHLPLVPDKFTFTYLSDDDPVINEALKASEEESKLPHNVDISSSSSDDSEARRERLQKQKKKLLKTRKKSKGLLRRWEVLQAEAVERQRQINYMHSLQTQMKNLQSYLENATERCDSFKISSSFESSHLKSNLKGAKELAAELLSRREEMQSLKGNVDEFNVNMSLTSSLASDMEQLQRLWEETNNKILDHVGTMEKMEEIWRSWQDEKSGLEAALEQDANTLKVLDKAIQNGAIDEAMTSNAHSVAKLLNEKKVIQGDLVTANKLNSLFDPKKSRIDESDSGTSGYESCSSDDLSERERRLAHLKRLARDLEATLIPGSKAWKEITETIFEAEGQLCALQKQCNELLIRTAEKLEPSMQDKSISTIRKQENKDDNRKRSRWRRTLWRTVVPLQAALLILVCVALLVEPKCCDSVNRIYNFFGERHDRGPLPT